MTKGAATTPDGVFRVYAGLRSDPFILAWLLESLKPFPNLLQHDNVLSIVVEFDTGRVLDPSTRCSGLSPKQRRYPARTRLVGHEPPRYDWIGKPEQTNMRLNNPTMAGRRTCATFGINKRHSRSPRIFVPCSRSA